MWLRTETFDHEHGRARHPHIDQLGVASMQMKAALVLLDEFSTSAAAATLALALDHLDNELAAPPAGRG